MPALAAKCKAPGDDGLPYEFYAAFWERLAPRLLAVLNAAFHSASTTALPLSMRSGRITLLYKGKGADRTQPSSIQTYLLRSESQAGGSNTVVNYKGRLSRADITCQTLHITHCKPYIHKLLKHVPQSTRQQTVHIQHSHAGCLTCEYQPSSARPSHDIARPTPSLHIHRYLSRTHICSHGPPVPQSP